MHGRTVTALAVSAGLLLGAAWRPPLGMATEVVPARVTPTLAATATLASLTRPPSEVPQALDPGVAEETCVACRLAQQTTGSLPLGSFTLDPELSVDGVVVRVAAPDPHVRATLWQAMLARGALLDALRSGESMPLCESCAARRALLSQVEIRAQRTASGLTLAYASKNPAVVRQIHTLVRGLQAAPIQF